MRNKFFDLRKRGRKYYYKNREKILEKGEKFRKKNRGKMRKYMKKYYLEHKNVWQKKYGSTQWKAKIFEEFRKRKKPIRCAICGYNKEDILVIHHKIPISRGGTNDIDNIELLCPTHHAELHLDKTEETIKPKL